jgi:hypothetical protein
MPRKRKSPAGFSPFGRASHAGKQGAPDYRQKEGKQIESSSKQDVVSAVQGRTESIADSVPALPPRSRSDVRSSWCWSRSRLGAGSGAGAGSGGRKRCPRALLPRGGGAVPAIGCRPLQFILFYGRDVVSRVATAKTPGLHKLSLLIADVLSVRSLLGELQIAFRFGRTTTTYTRKYLIPHMRWLRLRPTGVKLLFPPLVSQL